MSPDSKPTVSLTVRRLIKAPIARVFEAWTHPEDMVHWFGPAPWQVTSAETDTRSGGAWKVCFHSEAEKRDVVIFGSYLEVRPNTRLVFTWVSDNPQMNFGETLVTVELTESGASTEVSITHVGFPAEPIRERHLLGWESCCDNLVALLDGTPTPR
jgi:uncharacterized protein YndB with AHSA1/START domain